MDYYGPPKSKQRRSPRAAFTRNLEVAWSLGSGVYVRRIAKTENISAHGALVVMESSPPAHEPIAVKVGPATTMGRIVRTETPRPDGQVPVAIELSVPNQTLWGVALPTDS